MQVCTGLSKGFVQDLQERTTSLHKEGAMEDDGNQATESAHAEDVHGLRLMTLLHKLVRERELKGAAGELGVDARTLASSLRRGRLSGHVRVALERLMLADRAGPVQEQGERLQALADRVGGLEERVDVLAEGFGNALDGVRSAIAEEARTVQGLGRRLARLDSGNGTATASEAVADGGERKPAAKPLVRREYPELVTWEAAPDDEVVFGGAWPLVDEWRGLWAGHATQGKGLSWLITEERIRELEVAMLEEHGLTLPPEKEPLRGMWRDGQLRWRRKTLDRVRRERAKRERVRWVRRALTLSLWWE